MPRITGIGAQLEVVADGAVVEQFIPDGPAARHGKLKTGDVIIGVGSGDDEIVSVAGMSLEQIVQRIRGQEGSTVRLQIKPADSEELQVYSLVRAVVPGTGGVAAPSNTAPQMDPGDVQVTGFNPDLLSGLALAGANLQPGPGRDDGILTAQEIAFLPLNGVDTVVLSACETGLGNTAGGEGLISVQRAFQISGARTTLASFWKVNDVVTQRLMVRFYRNLWEKDMSRLDALREAQLYVLNNPDAIRGASLDPDEQSRTRVSPLY
ncbi:MAG: CHAT domain-containing protein, partial [Planctomyces sp.]